MSIRWGHVLVSEGFRPLARGTTGFRYEAAARAIRAADRKGHLSIATLPMDTSDEGRADFTELVRSIKALQFDVRGIIMNGTEEELGRAFELGQQLGFLDYMCLCQPWRLAAGDDSRDIDAVFEDRANVFTRALRQAPGIARVHFEFLIPAEAQHFNNLPITERLSDVVNRGISRNVTKVIVDSAHLLGAHSELERERLFAELESAVRAGKVEYLHVSDPLTRNNVRRAVRAGRLPLRRFVKVASSGAIFFIDTEWFNADDQDLGPLRDNVPQFRGEGGPGWPTKEQMVDWYPERHNEVVETVELCQSLIAA